jgi:hypothetical protein
MLSQNIIFLLCSNSFIDLKQNVEMAAKEASTPIVRNILASYPIRRRYWGK